MSPIGPNKRVLAYVTTTILLATPLFLILFRRFGSSHFFSASIGPRWFSGHPYFSVLADGYWFVACFLMLGLLPFLLMRSLKFETAACGLGFGDKRLGIIGSLALLAVMLPVVWIVSRSATFSTYYPLNEQLGREALAWWQAKGPPDFLRYFLSYEFLYALYFVGWEFFFRGFMTEGLYPSFGFNSVLISTIPFALLHVGKPLPEALGSIIAGVALGWFALQTRSIWYGWFVHSVIAWSMDLCAIQARIAQLEP